MHELEAAHLLHALAEPGTSVIAAAASTIDNPACREALADPGVTVIWLHGDPAALARRFDVQRHRPRFGLAPEQLLAEQAAERDPLFRALDPIVVETDTRKPADAVAAALVELKNRR
jgi:shikimate kinase